MGGFKKPRNDQIRHEFQKKQRAFFGQTLLSSTMLFLTPAGCRKRLLCNLTWASFVVWPPLPHRSQTWPKSLWCWLLLSVVTLFNHVEKVRNDFNLRASDWQEHLYFTQHLYFIITTHLYKKNLTSRSYYSENTCFFHTCFPKILSPSFIQIF